MGSAHTVLQVDPRLRTASRCCAHSFKSQPYILIKLPGLAHRCKTHRKQWTLPQMPGGHDTTYLQSLVGDALARGVAAAVTSQPNDPVDFLGHWLLR